jgi:RNA polymerase sigma factor (TIGR02999 family)
MEKRLASADLVQRARRAATDDAQITHLITGWRAGDRSAENRVFETLYCALRAQALHCLRRENNSHSLSPTLLVNEAYLVLSKSRRLNVNDRDHFIRIVSRVMKNLLIDRARERKSISRGGGMRQVDWEDTMVRTESDADRILAVAAAVEGLATRSPELARLVELRFFCGFTEDETAQIEGRSPRTVRRQWAVARTRLMESLDGVY